MLAFLVLINKIKTFFKKNKYLSWDEWIYISLFLLMNSNIITSFAWSRIITFLIYGDQCSRKEKKKKYSSDCEKENFIWSFATYVVYIRPWKPKKFSQGTSFLTRCYGEVRA